MKQLLLLILVLVLSACTLTGTLTGKPIEEQKNVLVGFTTPLTGEGASWGIGVQEGAAFAYEELGGMTESGRHFRITYEDTQCDPTTTVSATQKLMQIDGAKIIAGEVCSADAVAQVSVVEQNKGLLLATGTSTPDLTPTSAYRIWPSDTFKGAVTAERMYADDIRRVAIIGIDNQFGAGLIEVFTDRFEELGGEVIATERYSEDEKGFQTHLIKALNQHPDALYAVLYPGGVESFYRTKQELDINIPIYADGDAFLAEGVMDAVGELADDTTYVINDVPIDEAFAQRYEAATGEEAGLLQGLGYDTVMVLADVIDDCGDNVACLRGELNNISYEGATGSIVFDENGDVVKEAAYYRIQGGEPVKLA